MSLPLDNRNGSPATKGGPRWCSCTTVGSLTHSFAGEAPGPVAVALQTNHCSAHRTLPLPILQPARQIGADRTAWVIITAHLFAVAVGNDVVREGEQLFVPTVAHGRVSELALARAVAFQALDPQHDELAD
jgi:hypothetical protein